MAFTGITRGDALGIRYAFWGVKLGAYLNGVSISTLTDGTASSMARARSITEYAITRPAATAVAKVGDNGSFGTWTLNPTEAVTGNSGFAVFDETFETVATGRKIYTDGAYRVVDDSLDCLDYTPLVLILNSPATSQEAATKGQKGFYVHIYQSATASPSGETYNNNTAVGFPYSLIFDEVSQDIFGTAITDANFGVTQSYRRRFFSPYPVHAGAYVGTGLSSQEIVTDFTPAAATANAVQVAIDGTRRVITTDFTVTTATKTIAFTGTLPAAGAQAVYLYQFIPEC